jgi:LmbE family N-acetylglucosaminyl deacetylase
MTERRKGITAPMRWIYLSPHPDDAALCAGGLIYDQSRAGEVVEIWTLMSGFPETEVLSDFAVEMHARWLTTSARETIELRREEDRLAATILGVKVVHFNFVDAIYRRGRDGSALYADPVSALPHAEDAQLLAQAGSVLFRRLRNKDAVVCLLGIGDHVDHVLVRQAAETLCRPLLYVADFPYIVNHPEAIDVKTEGLKPSARAVSEEGLSAWVMAVESYRSQLSTVFEGMTPRSAIRDYWGADCGIRLWFPADCSTGLDSGLES